MKKQKMQLVEILAGVLPELEAAEIEKMIETPPDSAMGDFAFPCFKLAKVMRKAPQMIAADVAEKLVGSEAFSEVKNVNAYVNVLRKNGSADKIIKEYKQKRFIAKRAENAQKQTAELVKLYKSYEADAVPSETCSAWVELGEKLGYKKKL